MSNQKKGEEVIIPGRICICSKCNGIFPSYCFEFVCTDKNSGQDLPTNEWKHKCPGCGEMLSLSRKEMRDISLDLKIDNGLGVSLEFREGLHEKWGIKYA